MRIKMKIQKTSGGPLDAKITQRQKSEKKVKIAHQNKPRL